MRWLEVSLAVSAELAEAVADVLARFAPQGVVMSYEAGAGAGSLVEVRGYVAEGAADAAAQQRIREALWHLSQIQPLPEPAFQWIEEEDWAEAWKQHFPVLRVGRRLVIQMSSSLATPLSLMRCCFCRLASSGVNQKLSVRFFRAASFCRAAITCTQPVPP